MARFAVHRKDSSSDAIVAAVRAAGWEIWLIGSPCDALCFKSGKGFRTLEFKTANRKDGSYRPRKDQPEQNTFIEITGTPRVCTPEEALKALGL